MKAPFTNDELNRAIAQFGPIDQTIVELQAVINARDAEIIKLTSQLEEARAENKRIIIQRDAASMSNDLLQLSHKTLSDRDIEWGKEVLELRASVEEARAKAISECIAIADAELADPKSSGRSIAKLLRSLLGDKPHG